VCAAHGVGIEEDVPDSGHTSFTGHIVEVALGVRSLKIDSGRDDTVLERQARRHHLHRGGSPHGMADH
jgi:hypothetical protein